MSRSAGPTSKARSRAERKACSVYRAREKRHCRLVITEARIDALSVAAIEGIRADTLYAAPGGGMGPGTVQAIEHLLGQMARVRCSSAPLTPTAPASATPHASRTRRRRRHCLRTVG